MASNKQGLLKVTSTALKPDDKGTFKTEEVHWLIPHEAIRREFLVCYITPFSHFITITPPMKIHYSAAKRHLTAEMYPFILGKSDASLSGSLTLCFPLSMNIITSKKILLVRSTKVLVLKSTLEESTITKCCSNPWTSSIRKYENFMLQASNNLSQPLK